MLWLFSEDKNNYNELRIVNRAALISLLTPHHMLLQFSFSYEACSDPSPLEEPEFWVRLPHNLGPFHLERQAQILHRPDSCLHCVAWNTCYCNWCAGKVDLNSDTYIIYSFATSFRWWYFGPLESILPFVPCTHARSQSLRATRSPAAGSGWSQSWTACFQDSFGLWYFPRPFRLGISCPRSGRAPPRPVTTPVPCVTAAGAGVAVVRDRCWPEKEDSDTGQASDMPHTEGPGMASPPAAEDSD